MNKHALADSIRKAGFRATSQRVALLSFLSTAKKPVTIREIAETLGASIDHVTVYRMVEAFARAGLVREVNLRGEHARYELPDEHDHHHIVCTNCHKIEDFVGCDIDRIGEKALKRSRSFSKITGHSFDLYGLCVSCAT